MIPAKIATNLAIVGAAAIDRSLKLILVHTVLDNEPVAATNAISRRPIGWTDDDFKHDRPEVDKVRAAKSRATLSGNS